MKLPRDLTGGELVRLLRRHGYVVTRQTGSHIRLTSNHAGYEHHVTIPRHDPLKVGTLDGIIKDIAAYFRRTQRPWLGTSLNKVGPTDDRLVSECS